MKVLNKFKKVMQSTKGDMVSWIIIAVVVAIITVVRLPQSRGPSRTPRAKQQILLTQPAILPIEMV